MVFFEDLQEKLSMFLNARFAFPVSFMIVAAVTSVAAWAEEPTKIATVDLQKALQTIEAGKKAKASLEKEMAAKKTEVQEEEKVIVKMRDELQKQSLALNEKALAQKQQELQGRMMKFQEKLARSQGELQQKEQELTRPLLNKLRAIIAEQAKAKSYTLVLEKNENTVLYSLDKDDLTAGVIETFNKQNK